MLTVVKLGLQLALQILPGTGDAATFTGDLRLLPVLNEAGIDSVAQGNNHIMDAEAPD